MSKTTKQTKEEVVALLDYLESRGLTEREAYVTMGVAMDAIATHRADDIRASMIPKKRKGAS